MKLEIMFLYTHDVNILAISRYHGFQDTVRERQTDRQNDSDYP